MLRKHHAKEAPAIKYGEPVSPPLIEKLTEAKQAAEDFINEKASELHEGNPTVPVEAIKISLLRRDHAVDAALRLLKGDTDG